MTEECWLIKYTSPDGSIRRVYSGHNSVADYRDLFPDAVSVHMVPYITRARVDKLVEMKARIEFLLHRFNVLVAVAMDEGHTERAAAIRQCIDEIEGDDHDD